MIETVRAAEEQFKSALRAYNEACEEAKTFERVVTDTIHRWENERNRDLYGKALLKVVDEKEPRNSIGQPAAIPYRVEMVSPIFQPTPIIKRNVISDELCGLLKQQGIYHL